MKRNEFLDIIDGKTVAIVGNGDPDRDYSAEIDAADVVIRFNHFYNMDGGKVGKRVDVIFQIFTGAWNQAANKHADIIREQNAHIFCVRKPEQYAPPMVAHFLGPDVCVSDMSDFFRDHNEWTCGGTVLSTLAGMPINAKIRCYCFPQGDVAKKYFEGPASHYKNWREELDAQKRAIEILEGYEVRRARHADENAIVIPIKASSDGAPGKNEALLPMLLEKLSGVGRRIVLVGKADELANAMVEKYGVEYFRTGDPTGDVTDDLRMWRDFTDFCGEVVLLQCTSPNFRVSWIDALLAARRHAPVAAVCTAVDFKTNGIFAESEGVWMQLVANFGPPTVGRQKLPKAIHLTGGGFAFHSDALDRKSFFNAGVMKPVIVGADDALDIDTAEDLKMVGVNLAHGCESTQMAGK